MKIYLAARYSRHEEMQQYAKELTTFGHEITSRWINGSHEISDERLAIEDYHDLSKADCAIFFTEPPDSKYSRGGRHVEFGIAIERKILLIVVGFKENIFYFGPWSFFYKTWDEAFNHIAKIDINEIR